MLSDSQSFNHSSNQSVSQRDLGTGLNKKQGRDSKDSGTGLEGLGDGTRGTRGVRERDSRDSTDSGTGLEGFGDGT